MTRKRCRRKHYALVDVVAYAIAGAAITDTARLDKLRLLELSALDSFKRGEPTTNDWRAMADVINVAQTMAEMGIGPEVLPACTRAEEALQAGHARFKVHGRIGRVAGEYEALAEICSYHDLQRSSVGRSEYERAIQRAINRVRSGSKDVKVML